MTHIVDASVACKWFLQEELSSEARNFAGQAGHFFAPELILAECANVAWRQGVSGMISIRHAQEFTRALPDWFEVLTPSRELREAALEMAVALGHPLYDCMYLALAQRRALPLVTADHAFVRRVHDSAWAHLVRDLRSLSAQRHLQEG